MRAAAIDARIISTMPDFISRKILLMDARAATISLFWLQGFTVDAFHTRRSQEKLI